MKPVIILILIYFPYFILPVQAHSGDLDEMPKLKGSVKMIIEQTRLEGKDEILINNKSIYDSNGEEIYFEQANGGNVKYTIDPDKLTKTGLMYSSEGKFKGKLVYYYNGNGDLLTYEVYDAAGKLDERWDHKYNDSHRETETIYNLYVPSHKKTTITKFEYEKKGGFDVVRAIESEGQSESTITSDAVGHRRETVNLNPEGNILSKAILKYDNDWNLLEARHFDSEGRQDFADVYVYEFDSTGNWIKKSWSHEELRKGDLLKSRYVTNRTITYF